MRTPDDIQVYYVRVTEVAADGTRARKKGIHPVGCVAVKRTPDGVARGISICAPTDNWCRKKGRARAITQLHKAIGCKCNGSPIGYPVPVKGAEKMPVMVGDVPLRDAEGHIVMEKPSEPRQAGWHFLEVWSENYGAGQRPGFKSAWNPGLTKYETELLNRSAERSADTRAKITAAVNGIGCGAEDIPAVTAAEAELEAEQATRVAARMSCSAPAPAEAQPPTCQCCHGCTCHAHD